MLTVVMSSIGRPSRIRRGMCYILVDGIGECKVERMTYTLVTYRREDPNWRTSGRPSSLFRDFEAEAGSD